MGPGLEPRGWVLAGLLSAGALFFALPATSHTAESTAALRHITLDKTVPGSDSVVVAPVDEVRLFFSGAPLLRGASVRVVDSGRKLVRTSPPAADPEDPKQLFVAIAPGLAPGAYVVQWRCIADDGHVMRDEFSFEVRGE